jgi:HD-GYP domain-containing protein (c-di-GMP phosphodiesterase class II)
LPHALIATAIVIVLPALVVLPLTPLHGVADLALSAVLATGLSVAAGSACSALWTRSPHCGEIAFGDLMLWSWARRVRAERRLAAASDPLERPADVRPATVAEDPLLPALTELVKTLEAREAHMRGHTRRVTKHARRIATELGLPGEEVERIAVAASLHDVGLVGMPRTLLAKTGDLTEDERALLERHADEGAELVAALGDPELTAIVRSHHERLDGSGYPDHLQGDAIPVGARVVAVADSFDRLTTAAGPTGLRGQRNALDQLAEQSGSTLDPDAVSAFLGYYSGRRAIAGVALVATAPQRAVRWLVGAPAVLGGAAPPLAQGVCAAGAAAIAGICIGGPPALDLGDRKRAASPSTAQAERPTTVADSGVAGEGVGVGGGDRKSARDRSQRRGDGGAPSEPGGGDGGSGTSPGSGSPPATDPGGGTTSPGGGGSPSAGQPGSPVQTPEVTAPEAPSAPSAAPIVDGLVDTVNQVLAPLPTEQLTDPVKQVLDPLLGGR